MGVFRTDDGFEFETTRGAGVIRCICRLGSEQVEVVVTALEGQEPGPDLLEQAEMLARTVFLAEEQARKRWEQRERDRELPSDQS